MTDPSAAGPLTHGFLFADLRGYTAYAEARGDAAAADLLDKYRVLVRGVLGELGGAEIKTEGDSFYLVFPSASRAVAAGLAIVVRAAEASAADPTSPIRAGVGVHAGEAEERAEGYVGTAVNIAARVCAQARPGEVLVTETVRALTRTSGRYRFIARGRPALKGIAEPVALFAVESADAAGATGTPVRMGSVRGSRPRLALVAVALVAVVGIAAIGALNMVTSRGQLPSAGASIGFAGGAASARASNASAAGPAGSASSSSPAPFTGGRLTAGRHCSETFTPSICLVTPAGWTAHTEIPQEILLSDQDLDNVGTTAAPIAELGSRFESVTISRPTVFVVPCSPIKHLSDDSYEPDTSSIETTAKGFIDQLRSNRALTVSPPLPTRLGAADANVLEVGLAHTCNSSGKQMVYVDFLQKRYGDSAVPFVYFGFTATPGAKHQLFVLTHDGALIVIAVTAPAAKFDEFANTAKGLLASLEFAGAP